MTIEAPVIDLSVARASTRVKGSLPRRLIRAELLKVRTTSLWWVFALLALVLTLITVVVNLMMADGQISDAALRSQQMMPDYSQLSGQALADAQQQYLRSADVHHFLVVGVANVLTSGQYFGLLLMVILGAVVVTNEFRHQTATTTFLATPRRTVVIFAKLAAAALLAGMFWLGTAVVNFVFGSYYFLSNYSLPLGEWPVLRALMVNLLAYVIWAILGVGLGVFLRSQLGATMTGSAFYLLSYPIASVLFTILYRFVISDAHIFNWMIVVPGVASDVLISPDPVVMGVASDGTMTGPPWWVGALVLIGYGLLAGVVGTLITRKRDIS
jgi:ABC-type transport system involved in multi-copper enzyme maturation permease subunit